MTQTSLNARAIFRIGKEPAKRFADGSNASPNRPGAVGLLNNPNEEIFTTRSKPQFGLQHY